MVLMTSADCHCFDLINMNMLRPKQARPLSVRYCLELRVFAPRGKIYIK